MGIIVRNNERSWAIEIISQINLMLARLNLKIKRAGGERTLSFNKKVCFRMYYYMRMKISIKYYMAGSLKCRMF